MLTKGSLFPLVLFYLVLITNQSERNFGTRARADQSYVAAKIPQT